MRTQPEVAASLANCTCVFPSTFTCTLHLPLPLPCSQAQSAPTDQRHQESLPPCFAGRSSPTSQVSLHSKECPRPRARLGFPGPRPVWPPNLLTHPRVRGWGCQARGPFATPTPRFGSQVARPEARSPSIFLPSQRPVCKPNPRTTHPPVPPPLRRPTPYPPATPGPPW